MNLNEIMKAEYHKELSKCSNQEIYDVLLKTVQGLAEEKVNNYINDMKNRFDIYFFCLFVF